MFPPPPFSPAGRTDPGHAARRLEWKFLGHMRQLRVGEQRVMSNR
jgi:hypothetical protein